MIYPPTHSAVYLLVLNTAVRAAADRTRDLFDHTSDALTTTTPSHNSPLNQVLPLVFKERRSWSKLLTLRRSAVHCSASFSSFSALSTTALMARLCPLWLPWLLKYTSYNNYRPLRSTSSKRNNYFRRRFLFSNYPAYFFQLGVYGVPH